LIVNTSTGKGFFGNTDGSFKINVKKNELIKVLSHGFTTGTISLKDSTLKDIYHVIVTLKALEIKRKDPVIIRPKPTQEEISKSKSKIGELEYDPWIMTSKPGILSPVSLFYYLFSKKEKEKRAYINLLIEDQYMQAMKKIIRFFIDAELISLEENEIEKFIDHCAIDPEFVKYASIYEIGEALDSCYKEYKTKEKY
ncbi:MAG: hypothetical protein WD334_06810, partial [Chitinophagales bacterium]